jgi:hypothetical protein
LAIPVTPPAAPPGYESMQPTTPAAAASQPHPADQIANNPAIYRSNGQPDVSVYNTTSASQLMSAAVSGKGSFSYDIVAGAAFTGSNALSVDPNAVVANSALTPAVNGNVTVNGHTSYTDPLAPQNTTIDIPTLVRTGTGSITIAAAGNVELLDQVAPGAIYTAGAAKPVDFNAPAVPAIYAANPNGLVSTPAWAINGGAINVTAGGSIIGIEMPTDDARGSQTGVPNGPAGQMWSDWYVHFNNNSACGTVACQQATWINYASFFQGFGSTRQIRPRPLTMAAAICASPPAVTC